MGEYNQLKEEIRDNDKLYKIIDKLGYDDWNKKQVIREYILELKQTIFSVEEIIKKTRKKVFAEMAEYYQNEDEQIGDFLNIKVLGNLDKISKILRGNNKTTCNHKKVYDESMYLSLPPQRKWECKKCGEVGYDKQESKVERVDE